MLLVALYTKSALSEGYDIGGPDPICWRTKDVGLDTQEKVQLNSCPKKMNEGMPPDEDLF